MKPNNTENRHKKLDLKSVYQDIQPDGWAVTRMRARLRTEGRAPDTSELALQIFRRYVLAFSVMMVLLLVALEFTAPGRAITSDSDLTTWFLGDGVAAAHESELEYSFLLD